MKLFVILLGVASYSLAFPTGGFSSSFAAPHLHGGVGGGAQLLGGIGGGYAAPCNPPKVRNTDGTCEVPEVNRKVYVFAAQETPQAPIVAPPIQSEPEVNIDVVFVKTPEGGAAGGNTIVAPAPEQKTVVYVLSKRPTVEQQVIEVPSNPQEPEVFFVNYDDDDNPTLPGGITLQSALQQAAKSQGRVVEEGKPDYYY